MELVRNAVTAKGAGARVRLSAGRADTAGLVLIRADDNGPGMDPPTLAAAFIPFFSRRPAGRGRGMGLALAGRTIQANRGRIWLESRPGQGATVFVELPQAVPEATA